MYKYRVYNNLFWIFLIQMEYRLQMVGRAASVVSPFYSLLSGFISFQPHVQPLPLSFSKVNIIGQFRR